MSTDQVFEQQNEKARKKGRGRMLTLALLVFLVLAVPVVGYLIFTMRAANLVEDAYTIYSIGPDRVDDGGQIIEEEGKFANDVQNPDLIFPVKRVEKKRKRGATIRGGDK